MVPLSAVQLEEVFPDFTGDLLTLLCGSFLMVSRPILYILIDHFAAIKVIQAVVEVEIEFCDNNSNTDPVRMESGKR